MEKREIVSVLKEIAVFSELPDEQLVWLVSNSELKLIESGDFLFKASEPAEYLYVILSGSFRIYFERDSQKQEVADLVAKDITGVLPYSRMKMASAMGEAREKSVVLALNKSYFSDLICNHHDLTEVLVHQMTDRIRNFTTLQQQNEKLASLGKLSAGLAHELNNPSAAVVRSSEALKKHLQSTPEKFKLIMEINVTPDQVDLVNTVLFSRMQNFNPTKLSLMEKTALEDDLTDWMDDKQVENSLEWAEIFAEYGFEIEDLEKVNELVPDESLEPVLGWMAGNLITEKMVIEIADASKRISELVSSVKNYTHMDRAQDKQPTNLHEGLRSTITMLGHKFRQNRIELEENFGDIPFVAAFPGEVNQVFTNIIDNALDAMEVEGGKLTISTLQKGDFVEVRIADTGSGIPEDVIKKIFDPFFTTKAIGKGTGLGLDLVLKIMKQRHRGDVKVESKPGNTSFTLCFPIKA